ncbi:MAG: phospholipase [Pirellulales bacterium]|nr:phospholipase [Pirellulales bacterium]
MAMTSDQIRTLHRIHRQLEHLEDRRARGPRQMQAQSAGVKKLEGDHAQAKSVAQAARMAADQKQLQLKSNEGKIEDLQVKLNTANSNKEYQALKEQIAADKMANSVLEDEILESMDKIEELQVAVRQAQERLEKGKAELVKLEGSIVEQLNLIEGDIKRLSAELAQAEASLPDDFRATYDRLVKSMGADAMAEVEGEICSGCFTRIPPNKISQMMLSHEVTCLSCGRLLYLPEDRAPKLKAQ